ncbi:MAG: pyridoxal-phosphate dependent enzyme [Planctomycetota bacterium]
MESPLWRSPNGNPLMVAPLPGIRRGDIAISERSIWRYRAAFPISIETPISLGEGCTPLVQREFGGASAWFKLEWFSPTGSFKDRGASFMLSALRQQGITSVLEDSSGNGGAAIAGFGAAGAMDVKVLAPESTVPAKISQIRAYGATVELIPGSRDATAEAAIRQSESIFYASHNWQPFFLQGTKTLGYEIWEDLGFQPPDNIIIPVGAGSNLLGCSIAFDELKRSGEITQTPRLFVSQPANCAPIHHAFQSREGEPTECAFQPTLAEGTAIRKPVRLREVVDATRASGGDTIAIEESQIADATRALARQGLFVEPTCAQAAAAFTQLLSRGMIQSDQRTVVVLTGTGLKSSGFFTQISHSN